MQIELIYRNGAFVPTTPLHMKKDGVKIMVNVPDEDVDATPEPEAAPVTGHAEQGFLAELNAIRQPIQSQLDASASKPLSKDERRELLSEEWEERHRDNE